MAGQAEDSDTSVLFLPGAAGDGSFWQGVGRRLPESWEKRYLDWPGLGNRPPHPEIKGMGDLLALAEENLHRPSIVVAQSMGGIVAIQLALRQPDRVTHLVLAATSGGMDVAALGGADWRPDFLAAYPNTARWILSEKPDLSSRLSGLQTPTLLLWGARDPVSPPAVGKRLVELIPAARLVVLPEGRHSLAADMPEVVAPLIAEQVLGIG